MPEYKVETLYSGTIVGVYILGTQCLNTAPFCAGSQALVLGHQVWTWPKAESLGFNFNVHPGEVSHYGDGHASFIQQSQWLFMPFLVPKGFSVAHMHFKGYNRLQNWWHTLPFLVSIPIPGKTSSPPPHHNVDQTWNDHSAGKSDQHWLGSGGGGGGGGIWQTAYDLVVVRSSSVSFQNFCRVCHKFCNRLYLAKKK